MISLFIPLGQLGFAPKNVQVRVPRSPEPFRVFGQWRREYHVSSLDAQQLENFSIQNHLKPSKGVVNLSVMLISPKKLLWNMFFFMAGPTQVFCGFCSKWKFTCRVPWFMCFGGKSSLTMPSQSIASWSLPCPLVAEDRLHEFIDGAARLRGSAKSLDVWRSSRKGRVWEGWQQRLWKIYGKRDEHGAIITH